MSRTAVLGSVVLGSAVGAVGSLAALYAAQRLPAGVRQRWQRTNHAGAEVTLLEGPAWVAGVLGAVAAGAIGHGFARGRDSRTAVAEAAAGVHTAPVHERGPWQPGDRAGTAAALVAVASAALGALDDLAGSTASKGLKGHLGALARGEVTTGAVKVVGLALTGLAGAALVDEDRRSALDTLLGGAVVAAAANVVNLFDLRPGRALKVVVATSAPLALTGAGAAAPALGASLGVLAPDLAGRAMLGDTGANAAGALLGLAVVERCGPVGRSVALAVLTGLTLASERVSFTRVIEHTEVLRRIDEWGRSPR